MTYYRNKTAKNSTEQIEQKKIYTCQNKKNIEALTGSGPKGRGFESRHFDIIENPGSVRLPGFFLRFRISGNPRANRGKLGESQAKESRKPL